MPDPRSKHAIQQFLYFPLLIPVKPKENMNLDNHYDMGMTWKDLASSPDPPPWIFTWATPMLNLNSQGGDYGAKLDTFN